MLKVNVFPIVNKMNSILPIVRDVSAKVDIKNKEMFVFPSAK